MLYRTSTRMLAIVALAVLFKLRINPFERNVFLFTLNALSLMDRLIAIRHGVMLGLLGLVHPGIGLFAMLDLLRQWFKRITY